MASRTITKPYSVYVPYLTPVWRGGTVLGHLTWHENDEISLTVVAVPGGKEAPVFRVKAITLSKVYVTSNYLTFELTNGTKHKVNVNAATPIVPDEVSHTEEEVKHFFATWRPVSVDLFVAELEALKVEVVKR